MRAGRVSASQPEGHHAVTSNRPEAHETSVNPSTIRPWIELKSSGLLWLLNASVLHPRGFALALVRDPRSREIVGWRLLGDGSEPWRFDGAESGSCDQNFADVEALFACAKKTTPTEGHVLVIGDEVVFRHGAA